MSWNAVVNNVVNSTGCPHCCSSFAEKNVRHFFEEERVCFTSQWKTRECADKRPLPFDFCISEWKPVQLIWILEPDGSQHFDYQQHGKTAFLNGRVHDMQKMAYAINNGWPVVRCTSRSLEHFRRETWKAWLIYVKDNYLYPLQSKPPQERRLIVLEDTPCYRTMFEECIKGDSLLNARVVFVKMGVGV
jgi:hypothetical protein